MTIALMALAGCDGVTDPVLPDSPGRADSRVARELDALALDTGALPDSDKVNPTGRYARRYEGGSDRLCLIPDGEARESYRFGAETRIGKDEYCRGTGSARLSANILQLDFDGAGKDCRIVARYEGDKIVLPGGIDRHCAALCSSRGSFSGVTFPRFDRDVALARQMEDRDGKLLCR
jgi:hypothetical protein